MVIKAMMLRSGASCSVFGDRSSALASWPSKKRLMSVIVLRSFISRHALLLDYAWCQQHSPIPKSRKLTASASDSTARSYICYAALYSVDLIIGFCCSHLYVSRLYHRCPYRLVLGCFVSYLAAKCVWLLTSASRCLNQIKTSVFLLQVLLRILSLSYRVEREVIVHHY